MKKVLLWGLVLAFVMAMPHFIDSAEAKKDKWETYKLTEDGENLDNSKWSPNENVESGTVAAMTIGYDPAEDESYVQFVHQSNAANASAWLMLVKNSECVKGIKVKVKMGDDLAGNFRARIGTVAGAFGSAKDYAWSQIAVRNWTTGDQIDRVWGALSLLDPQDDYSLIVEPVYTQFYHPEEVDGSTYTISMVLDHKKKTVTYTVDDYGSVTYKMPEKIVPGHETFWGIGTRSSTVAGAGTVWFYNKVKVLIDGKCKTDNKRPKVQRTWPKNKQKNVSVDLNQTKIKFKEAMRSWTAGCEDGSCCPKVWYKNEDNDWKDSEVRLCGFDYEPTDTFVFRNAGGPLESNTWFKICVPKDYFFDLAGNGNAKSCYQFKTGKAPD